MVLNLDKNFKPVKGEEIVFESFMFHGGEPHIRIEPFDVEKRVTVTARLNSFNDTGLLCIAVDALRRMGVGEIHVFIPYFPGARQDRVMVHGESLTVKVIADIINSLNVAMVTIVDPHSDVAPALLNNCKVISNHSFISTVLKQLPEDVVLISPDAGASKKIFKLASELHIATVIECGKKRDLATGKLSGFTVSVADLENRACLIVDDICDGGGTFIGLAKELKKKNAGDLFLAVSHGIFSKGFDPLKSIFKLIYTTDSVQNMPNSEKVIQIKLSDGSVS